MAIQEHAVATPALQTSGEIRQLMLRFYETASQGDFDAVDRLVSRQAGIRWIGTDPTEWFEDFDAVAKAWRTQAAAMGGPWRITAGDITAYQDGNAAWVSDRPTFHLSDGRSLPFRFTVVWLREPEGWRIVQAHASFGVANETAIRSA